MLLVDQCFKCNFQFLMKDWSYLETRVVTWSLETVSLYSRDHSRPSASTHVITQDRQPLLTWSLKTVGLYSRDHSRPPASTHVITRDHVSEYSTTMTLPVVNNLYEVGHQVNVVPPWVDALGQQGEDWCLQLGEVPQQFKDPPLGSGRQPGNNTSRACGCTCVWVWCVWVWCVCGVCVVCVWCVCGVCGCGMCMVCGVCVSEWQYRYVPRTCKKLKRARLDQ